MSDAPILLDSWLVRLYTWTTRDPNALQPGSRKYYEWPRMTTYRSETLGRQVQGPYGDLHAPSDLPDCAGVSEEDCWWLLRIDLDADAVAEMLRDGIDTDREGERDWKVPRTDVEILCEFHPSGAIRWREDTTLNIDGRRDDVDAQLQSIIDRREREYLDA